MQAVFQKRTSRLHAVGCNCQSCQNKRSATVADEILGEVYRQPAGNHSRCSCHSCTQARQQNELGLIRQELQRIGSGLSLEEELELGRALMKIKELAKKGIRNAKHPAFALLLKLASVFNPHPQLLPPEQTVDYARWSEEEKKRKREAAMQQAIRNKKPNAAGRPQ